MQRDYENHYHHVEGAHWWFCARREMVVRWVQRIAPGRDCRILDIGCSSGWLLRDLSLAGYTSVEGIDASADAIAICEQDGLRARVMDAHHPQFPEGAFGLVVASDVLEHLQRDAEALGEWRRVLAPGGWLLVFVPAFMWLWTRHDTINRHFRRYTRPQLTRLLAAAGFEVKRASYWNTALFPPVALVRLWRRRFAAPRAGVKPASDMFLPPALLNGMLRRWMRLENRLHAFGLNSPIGTSVMVMARRPAD